VLRATSTETTNGDRMTAPDDTGAPFVSPEQLERAWGRRFTLRLGANESAFGPSPYAIAAAVDELRRVSWYADPDSRRLTEAISLLTGIHTQRLLVGNGIDDLLGLVVRCVIGPGDVAVTTAGTYPVFPYHVRAYGGQVRAVPYCDRACVDLDGLLEAVVECSGRVVYVANPDNPTGSELSSQDMRRLTDRLPATALLLVDEAYGEYVGNLPNAPSVPEGDWWDRPNVIRCRTFSKAYGLAGLHVGYMVAREPYVEAVRRVRTQYGVNRVAQAAAAAALDDRSHLDAAVASVREMRSVYAEMGERHGWRPLESHTNFVTFDVGSAFDAKRLVEALCRRGAFVRGGHASPLEGYVRVTIGTESECCELGEMLAGVGREGLVGRARNAANV
jgi:histidinol-phosphate aminotransferase